MHHVQPTIWVTARGYQQPSSESANRGPVITFCEPKFDHQPLYQLLGEEASNKADPREPSEAGAAPLAGCALAGPSAPAPPPPAMKLRVTRQENKHVTFSARIETRTCTYSK